MSMFFRICRGAVRVLLVVCIAACATAPTAGREQETAAAAPAADPHPDLRRLSPTADIWVDPLRKEVVVGGVIALDRGMIEVFACPSHTKEHEAVVAVNVPSRLVHTALLAIGLEPGRPVSFDPEYSAAQGPPVDVTVRWHDEDGQPRRRPAREMIRSATTKEQLAADWVFAGSVLWRDPSDGQEYYQADGGDLICVSNFPTATLDLPLQSSPDNDSLMYEVFEGRVPARGTVVEIVLSAKP